MKIIFVCSSIEKGKDGIGDYTRKLSQICVTLGHYPVLVAINDKYVNKIINGVDDSAVPYYRFPQNMSWLQKRKEWRHVLENIGEVAWISLQFVSYGYNERGIFFCEEICAFKHMFKNIPVHLMMHELWVGEEKNANSKRKFFGMVQKWNVLFFIRAIRPNIVHTSIPLYRLMLEKVKIVSSLLPLFSNISPSLLKRDEFKENVPPHIYNAKDLYLIGCLFGSIYYENWDLSSILESLLLEKEKNGKECVMISIGKITYGAEFWAGLPQKYPKIQFLTLGIQEEKVISYWLQYFVDFGVVTTPAIIAGKSGSCMAFKEHGLPIFCKENELKFSFKIPEDLIFDRQIVQLKKNTPFSLPKRVMVKSQVEIVTQEFIQKLTEYQF